MNIQDQIDKFLKSEAFAVVGASTNRDKYGNKVFRCYQQHGMQAIPVNPKESAVEGVPCVASVRDLPGNVKSISIITPPQVTEQVVASAVEQGIENVWMQPGAESSAAVAICLKNNINVIAGGSCILVVLGYKEK